MIISSSWIRSTQQFLDATRATFSVAAHIYREDLCTCRCPTVFDGPYAPHPSPRLPSVNSSTPCVIDPTDLTYSIIRKNMLRQRA